jgi:hypothetical protein
MMKREWGKGKEGKDKINPRLGKNKKLSLQTLPSISPANTKSSPNSPNRRSFGLFVRHRFQTAEESRRRSARR